MQANVNARSNDLGSNHLQQGNKLCGLILFKIIEYPDLQSQFQSSYYPLFGSCC